MGRFATLTSLALVLAVLSFASDKYTRGVGIYRGNPDKDHAPELVSDASTYRMRTGFRQPCYQATGTSEAVREKSGDRILPALFTDNFISLMPGEQKSIQIQIEDADTRGEKPRIVLEGFNVRK
jgi:hypothetical protein